MPALQIHQIPVLNDNYVYLARDPDTGACACVDPAVSDAVLAALKDLGWTLTHILNTHHHGDHVGGNLAIKAATGCTIVGFADDAARIPGIDEKVREGENTGNPGARNSYMPAFDATWLTDAEIQMIADHIATL